MLATFARRAYGVGGHFRLGCAAASYASDRPTGALVPYDLLFD